MRLHYLRGDRAAALAAFDRCCDVLERTLGVAPRRRDRGAARPRRRQQPAGRLVAAAAAAGERAAPAPPDRPRRRMAAPARRLVDGHPSLVAGEAGLGKTGW
jgi:DNA-binding SARP family transcriptional activator